jgi:hypothetical protein
MEKKSILQSVGTIAISLGVLFGVVWVASKAWEAGKR